MTGSHFVGVAGFEPATSCSQSRHTNRTVLYPVLKSGAKIDLLFAFAKKILCLTHNYYTSPKKLRKTRKVRKVFAFFVTATIHIS